MSDKLDEAMRKALAGTISSREVLAMVVRDGTTKEDLARGVEEAFHGILTEPGFAAGLALLIHDPMSAAVRMLRDPAYAKMCCVFGGVLLAEALARADRGEDKRPHIPPSVGGVQ